ncbi:MAG: endonuclease V [Actinobacteria bacterium]|nr:endonuclease V [Actinomycetota bacterium]
MVVVVAERSDGWPTSPAQALALQARLAPAVIRRGAAHGATLVTGVDVHVRAAHAYAACITITLPDFRVVETVTAACPMSFPHVPGLPSFRELPAALAVVRRLARPPDALLVDGHGVAHPWRFGLACHLGVMLDLPTVGCAKSLLIGTYDPPAPPRGSVAALWDGHARIGAVVRTRAGVAPVFVSIGHRLSLAAAVALVLRCTCRYRLPEPARQAHLAARALVRA